MILDPYGRPMVPSPAAQVARPNGIRLDRWQNGLTGIGTDLDKTVQGHFTTVRRLSDVELTNLYNGSPLAAKIIEERPKELFREGYELECGDVDQSALTDLQDYAEDELHLSEHFLDAMIFGRQYGGDLLTLGVDDGNMPDEPLDFDSIKTFTWLNGIDRRFSYVLDYDLMPGPTFGKPAHYLTSNAIASYQYGSGGNAQMRRQSQRALESRGFFTAIVDASRAIRFEGVKTDIITRQTLAGWTWSVMQRVYDSLRRFEHSFDSAGYLLSDAAQSVLTLKGLIDAISAGDMGVIDTRMMLMERQRSVIRGIVLDEGEKWERQATPMTGVSDILDRMMLRLCADTNYPVTKLFGRAASGLNAAAGSDAETRRWYDELKTEQKNDLAPKYQYGYRAIAASADCPVKLPKVDKNGKPLRIKIHFKPLYTPTDLEEAQAELARMTRDTGYVTAEIITPEEAAANLEDIYPALDLEGREAATEKGQSFDPYQNDPDPPPPAIPPPGAPLGAGAAPSGPIPPAPGAPGSQAKPSKAPPPKSKAPPPKKA